MKTFSTSGTGGDTLISVLKLYGIKGKKKVRHYTIHENMHPVIKEIYSLLPNLEVEFVKERDLENPKMESFFARDYDYEPFPDFELEPYPDLPEDYIVVVPRAGRPNTSPRVLSNKQIGDVINGKNAVFLGSQKLEHEFDVLDLMGKTSMLEAFSIIRGAKHVYTPQGVTAFFALSQKVPTTVYLYNVHDVDGFYVRCAEEWTGKVVDWTGNVLEI